MYIPFKFIWYMYIKDFRIRETEYNREYDYIEDLHSVYIPRGKELWDILVGLSQSSMKWYYTSKEVNNKIRKK